MDSTGSRLFNSSSNATMKVMARQLRTRSKVKNIAVSPEHFMEFIVHLKNEKVKELVMIESGYTSVLFNDEEFTFPACSIEVHSSMVLFFEII